MKKRIALTLLTLVLLGGIAAAVFMHRQHAAMDRAKARAVAMSMPTTYDELLALYPVPPPEENAATVYNAAFDAMHAIENTRTDEAKQNFYRTPIVSTNSTWADGDPWTPDDLAAADAFIAEQAQVYDLITEATSLEACQFYDTYTDGHQTLLPHLATIRQLARMLRLKALVALEHGDTDQAVAASAQLGTIARHLGADPLLIGQLVRKATLRLALDTSYTLIDSRVLTDGQFQVLARAYDGLELTSPLRSALIAEVVIQFEQDFIVGYETNVLNFALARELPGIRDHLLAIADSFYIGRRADTADWALRCIEAAEAPLPEAIDRLDEIFADLDAGRGKAPLDPNLDALFRPFAQSFADSSATLRIFQTRIGLERYRLFHGTLPDTLQQLVPDYLAAVPIDPYANAPLQYIPPTANTSAILYSIGNDQQDDNGQSGDIAIEIAP